MFYQSKMTFPFSNMQLLDLTSIGIHMVIYESTVKNFKLALSEVALENENLKYCLSEASLFKIFIISEIPLP